MTGNDTPTVHVVPPKVLPPCSFTPSLPVAVEVGVAVEVVASPAGLPRAAVVSPTTPLLSNSPACERKLGKSHEVEIQVRFGDTDALGHVNNASFAQYAEIGRLESLGTIGEHVTSLILARLAIDFRAQVTIGDKVVVSTCVERIGRSSITLKQTITTNGTIAADVGSVVVYFDYATNRAKELPEDLKSRLSEFLIEPGSD